MVQRFRDSSLKQLRITNVEYMQTVKEKAIDRITISLVSDLIDENIVNELSEIVDMHPGNKKLYFELRDSLNRNHVLLRSRTQGVDVVFSLTDFIDQTQGMDYSIN
jgi:DNA polymerase-3 subunit alpha